MEISKLSKKFERFPMLKTINKRAKIYGILYLLATFGWGIRLIVFPEIRAIFNLQIYLTSLVFITFMYETMNLWNGFLNRHLPYENGLVKRIVVQTGVMVLFMFILLTVVYVFFIEYLPFEPNRPFIASTYAVAMLTVLFISFAYFGTYFFNAWKAQIIQHEKLQKERAVSELDNLKNQLNPHFLFNSLSSLNSLIYENPELAQQFLQHLSKVYRYVLQHKDKELVSLKTELDFIRNYVFLLQTRFGDGLKINLGIEPKFYELQLVPVTLQILIENAVKHNITGIDNPLKIDLFVEENYFVVKNNLQKKTIVETSNKVGLENMKNLYKALTGKYLIIEESSNFFTIKVPLL